jgi:hypothetical protein
MAVIIPKTVQKEINEKATFSRRSSRKKFSEKNSPKNE